MNTQDRIMEALLRHYDPSGTALLERLGARLDASMLQEIADSDYGHEADNNLRALRRMRDHGDIPVPLRGMPREVLELCRWDEPDETNLQMQYGSPGIRGHRIRAFCCTVLLKAADEPETQDYINAENETLIQLVASVLRLGREETQDALRLITWRVLRMPHWDGEYPFFALAVLLLRAALSAPDSDSAELETLAAWVIREETRARNWPFASLQSEDWLLGLTNFDQRHTVWQRVARDVLRGPAIPSPAAPALPEIVRRLEAWTKE